MKSIFGNGTPTQEQIPMNYKAELKRLQGELGLLQHLIYENKIGVIIIFEGWDRAGKGLSIAKLTERLDPRGFKAYTMPIETSFKEKHPFLKKYWDKLPAYGGITLFEHSWYVRVTTGKVERTLTENQLENAYHMIQEFERQLVDDKYHLLKVFTHISRKTQRKRLESMFHNNNLAWLIDDKEWVRHGKYRFYLKAYEEMILRSNYSYAPWVIIPSNKKKKMVYLVIKTIHNYFTEVLENHGIQVNTGHQKEENKKEKED